MDAEPTPAGEGLKKSLLQAARKCDMETMSKLLGEWRNIDLSFTDDAGKTLLHHCTSAGDKENSLLLLDRGAPPNKSDNMGMTPLHYAAKKDFTDIIESLVTHGAAVNAIETKTAQTALHITVSKNFLTTAQFLLFSGADASMKDKQGKSPIALCRSKEMRNLLAGFAQSTQGGLREIQLQTVDMQGGTKTFCDRLDLLIDYTDASPDDQFSVMCRKQAIDYSDEDFGLTDRDEIFSDVVNYRLGRKGRQTTATLTVPIFGELEIKEELVLKGNRGYSAPITSLKNEGQKYYGIVTIDMSSLDAFVVVSRPIKEIFNVDSTAVVLRSKVNPGVQLVIPPETFEERTQLTLEITDSPNPELFATTHMENVYSCTCFCSVHTENKAGPKNDVIFRFPLPEEYGQGGQLYAFQSNVYEIGDVSVDSWTALNTNVNVSNKLVEFSSRTFSVKACVETKKGIDPSTLTDKVHIAFEKAKKREYTVMFLVMSKRIGNGNTFTIIVECTKVENAESRKEYWLEEGYTDQKPTQSSWFNAYSRYKYRCKLSKSFQNLLVNDSDEVYLQFHARRINYQCFTLQMAENFDEAKGDLQIFSVKSTKSRDENKDLSIRTEKPDKTQPDKPLASISIQLFRNVKPTLITPNIPPMSPTMDDFRSPTRTTMTPVDVTPTMSKMNNMKGVNFKEEAKGDPSWKGFTNDSFLHGLLDQLDEEWYKLVVLLGIPYKEVDTVLHMTEATQDQKIYHFLLRWRDSSRARDDLGMANLITAVSKGGRRDICTSILLDMKQWYENDGNKKTKFWRWVNKAFTDPDIYNPGDYPPPMSDQFLVLLTQSIENPNFEVGVSLGMSRVDTNNILEDKLMATEEHKLLAIFVEARDKKSSKSEALRSFVNAMGEVEMLVGKKWVIMAAENWLEANKKNDDPFVKEVESVLRPMHLIS
ncbi:uncharacterized protein LOC127726679 isoform X1 [Mytilus californianus]|uniref:uncharacterized protein LOC127726679 isoform X1 n=1 Tax=Mytilus californianus TaxID=6549 RepID=UPI00224827A7|nr:uncharacterized protein LOC127726679 isoform X1 [Mytilus californianus]